MLLKTNLTDKLMDIIGVFHWSRPYIQLYDCRVGFKKLGVRDENPEKSTQSFGQFHLPDRA